MTMTIGRASIPSDPTSMQWAGNQVTIGFNTTNSVDVPAGHALIDAA